MIPGQFPYQANWKQDETHAAYWELFPTLDHVVPLARGGRDDESNAVTTSMLRNAAKANWPVEELGWPAERAPVMAGWDGLVGWFLEAWDAFPELRAHAGVAGWRAAAVQAEGE